MTCPHGVDPAIEDCGRCPCPGGGRHVWVERTSYAHEDGWGCGQCGAASPYAGTTRGVW